MAETLASLRKKGGGSAKETEWMDWNFGDSYGTSDSSLSSFSIYVKGYSSLVIYQNAFNDANRTVDIYAGSQNSYTSRNNLIQTVCQDYNTNYTVDISSYDYITLSRHYPPLRGVRLQGKYKLVP